MTTFADVGDAIECLDGLMNATKENLDRARVPDIAARLMGWLENGQWAREIVDRVSVEVNAQTGRPVIEVDRLAIRKVMAYFVASTEIFGMDVDVQSRIVMNLADGAVREKALETLLE